MSGSREKILGRIRGNLDQADAPGRASQAEISKRMGSRPRGIIPTRVDRDAAGLVDLFIERAMKVNASVVRLDTEAQVPDAIADYLASENLPAAFRMAENPDLEAMPWSNRPALDVKTGPSDGNDIVGLSRAVCGVAETGTLMMMSGPNSPITLNFLPETHVVVIKSAEIKAAYEDGWDVVRAKGALPRSVNMVTGPSRTGDIEQTIYLGAHGPRRLHILVVDDD